MHSVGDNSNSSNVPAFLVKLWKLVDERTTDDLIKWNPSGMSFTIRDQAKFARELLPLYYKHNNMASFVRQLNMYGFHKVVSVDSGSLKADRDDMEFAHTYFLRGHEYLLEHIKRKIPISKQEETKAKPELMSRVLCDVRSMKGKQDSLDSRLAGLKKENESLWREVASLRQKHIKQQQIVNKLIQFLITVVQPNGRAGLGLKRRHPLMLEEVAHSAKEAEIQARKEEDSVKKASSFTARHKDTDFSHAPTLCSQTPGGPVIHDVTDLIDDPGNDGVVEVPIDDEDDISYMTTPTVTEANDVTSQPCQQGSGLQPDLSIYENSQSSLHSPLSPELLVAIDPREVSGRQPQFVVENPPIPSNGKNLRENLSDNSATAASKEELDHQLDAIQMDLDNLREFLSLQTESVDPSALLGMFTSAEPTVPGPFLCVGSGDPQASNSSHSEAVGNEIISYNPSFFELTADDNQFLNPGTNPSASAALNADLDSSIDDFLGIQTPHRVEEPSIKKRKR